MLSATAVLYGFLAIFILLSAQRNVREKRPHPPALRHLGYMMVGLSAGAAMMLTSAAVAGISL